MASDPQIHWLFEDPVLTSPFFQVTLLGSLSYSSANEVATVCY